jgi:hypothetical protein
MIQYYSIFKRGNDTAKPEFRSASRAESAIGSSLGTSNPIKTESDFLRIGYPATEGG